MVFDIAEGSKLLTTPEEDEGKRGMPKGEKGHTGNYKQPYKTKK
jgi:hypothetical protein